jgi:UDP-N-acetylglucosamine--N-acetylmuramyl-(pentapeptide) pyrophosphoryl-undecaprenol N-acetylglucosamine transferase
VDLIWVTGPATYEQFKQYHHPPSVQVIPFLDPMADGYAVADLVVSRAGMITVAELCAWGLPSVLIPLPTAAADHQAKNAATMAAAGAAVLLPQAELTPERLKAEVWALLQHPEARAAVAARALARGRPHAARDIAGRLAALAR